MKKASNIIPEVDTWNPAPEDIIFTNTKNIIYAPIHKIFGIDDSTNTINYFMVNQKKSYNSDELRNHNCLYLNYFEKYFDEEKEYFTNLGYIKWLVDYVQEYGKDELLRDIQKYFLQSSLFTKCEAMVERNYNLSLSYKSANNPQLQYTNDHAKAFMQISILMNLLIPLITHFAYMRRVQDIDEFLLDVYDLIIYAEPFTSKNIDIWCKLYETSISNVTKNEKSNPIIWAKQSIRGKDTITHSVGACKNIVLNIMPKYTFEKSMVSLNYTSIQKANKFQVTDIAYEYSYISLSSSKRDGEDNASEMDKYESNLIKTDEACYLQSKVNCEYTMKIIEDQWGPFDQEEINFYMKELRDINGEIINGFQKQLIFNLFYKYFGDAISINAINAYDYIKLMLAAKKMLKDNLMSTLPYIISSKVDKIVGRKSLNKKEQSKMRESQYFELVKNKYQNEKILDKILGTIATIITSSFKIIDKDPSIHGKIIPIESDIIIDEILLYILLI